MNFKDHFLIAMPSLKDSPFAKTVVYICEHTRNGAMGIIVNSPIPELTIKTFMIQLGLTANIETAAQQETALDAPIFYGGPLSQERGFILHSTQAGFKSSLVVSPEVMLTTSKDILETLGTEAQPHDLLITLGYSSWTKGQLEQEIINNDWQIVEADTQLLFHTPVAQRWDGAAEKLGVNILSLASEVGHA